MLGYTGHPLVDVGMATIAAFASKRKLAHLSEDDLRQAGEFLERVYFDEKWRGVMFTIFPNSAYTQPKISEAKKQAYIDTFIHGYLSSRSNNDRCAFCGKPALIRNFRQHIPLLTGEGTINFFPGGQAGLPACGVCLLAIQAFLLGSVKCAGRRLLVHSDDEAMTIEFAQRFLTDNRRALSLSAEPENLSHPRTYFVARLIEIEVERKQAEVDEIPCSMTAYHLTNYGTNPDITLYHFPNQLVAFLRQALRAPHDAIWRQIERRAWELKIDKVRAKGKEKDKPTPLPMSALAQPRATPGQARNYLYEDLFDLPHNAAHFVRTYFLRRAYRSRFESDPRRLYQLQRELQLVSWTLTAIFLKEVMNMDPHRIETIKRVADRLASYISVSNDRQLFRWLWMSRRYGDFRRALVTANTRNAQNGKEPLLSFEDFVTAFEFSEESGRPDWNLARDLVLIRVIEQLHQGNWFGSNPDVIAPEEIAQAAVEVTNENGNSTERS
jgi:CRISPR-associated protein Cst1